MRRSLVTANSEEFIFGDMDEIYFENDDYFLPNGDDESIWQIMDTIVIEKGSIENEINNNNNNSTISSSNNINKRTLSEISSNNNNNNHLTNYNNNSNKSFIENISNKKTKAEPDIPKFETSDKDEVIFFSNTKDPFAQTTWMVLLEKKIPFKYIEVSSDKLPEWFLKLNPEGTIPAIKHEETVIYDCNIINEFLEDLFPDKSSLLPKLPHEKAKARLIIKKIQELISPFSELLQAQTLETQIHRGQALRKKLKEVNEYLSKFNPVSINGPYLLGNDFSLLDCVLLPFYERMSVVLPHVRNWKIPSTTEFQLLEDWYFRASKRLSFQETRKIKDSKYEEYLLKEYQIVGTII